MTGETPPPPSSSVASPTASAMSPPSTLSAFRYPPSSITVLLGPNGAGKTTAIRVITGALSPRVGEMRTFGFDPRTEGDGFDPAAAWCRPSRRCTTACRATTTCCSRPSCTASPRQVDQRIRGVGPLRHLRALDHQVGGYSTGMKTRLALARSVLHQPDLLLFDEPTSGLDPESAHAVLELIRDMTADGRTVVM